MFVRVMFIEKGAHNNVFLWKQHTARRSSACWTLQQALTAEVDAVTEAARRRAEEGAAEGDGSSNGGGIIASTGKGSAVTRPLMPRSLRGKPPVVSSENPDARENKQTQGTGKVVTKSFGCTGGGGAGVQEVVTKQVAIKSGCEGGESAGVPKVSASASALAAEDEASPGPGRRKKNGARRAANATPRLATDAVSQSTSGDGVVLDPAFTQEREITVAAEPEPGPGARRGARPPFGSHASDEYDGAEGAADATIDVRCLSGCAVSFRREDFVIEPHGDRGYDVVCLFSVIKWMHLNGGDEAVRNVFRKAHALLRPGGRLVLEPQVWCASHTTTSPGEKYGSSGWTLCAVKMRGRIPGEERKTAVTTACSEGWKVKLNTYAQLLEASPCTKGRPG